MGIGATGSVGHAVPSSMQLGKSRFLGTARVRYGGLKKIVRIVVIVSLRKS